MCCSGRNVFKTAVRWTLTQKRSTLHFLLELQLSCVNFNDFWSISYHTYADLPVRLWTMNAGPPFSSWNISQQELDITIANSLSIFWIEAWCLLYYSASFCKFSLPKNLWWGRRDSAADQFGVGGHMPLVVSGWVHIFLGRSASSKLDI